MFYFCCFIIFFVICNFAVIFGVSTVNSASTEKSASGTTFTRPCHHRTYRVYYSPEASKDLVHIISSSTATASSSAATIATTSKTAPHVYQHSTGLELNSNSNSNSDSATATAKLGHGFRYHKIQNHTSENENNHEISYATIIESFPLLTQQPFLCPSVKLQYDAEWKKGTRISIILGILSRSTNWVLKLKGKNMFHLQPTWKVTIEYDQLNQMYIFRPKDIKKLKILLNNTPDDNDLQFSMNQFGFLSEKIKYEETTEIEKVIYSQVNEFGQPIFECTMTFDATTNNNDGQVTSHKDSKSTHSAAEYKTKDCNNSSNETKRFRRSRSSSVPTKNYLHQHERRLTTSNENCTFLITPPLTIARDYICYRNASSQIKCNGNNNDAGQLNAAQTQNSLYTQISGYDNHVCAINSQGHIDCWGAGYRDSNGNPVQPPPGNSLTISTGGLHACAVTSNRNANCWGNNDFYQCNNPVANYLQVQAGYLHTCGLTYDKNNIVCWGYCDNNECINPTQFLPPPYVQISTGNRYTCAVNFQGQAKCWGLQFMGMTNVPANLKYKQITASKSGFHTCGLLANNTALCWGDSFISSRTPRTTPFVYIEAGANHVCGLTNSSAVVCWGYSILPNLQSAIGTTVPESCIALPNENATGNSTGISDPIINITNSSRVALNFDAYKFSKIVSAGIAFGCGNNANGFVYCWGDIYVTPDMQIFQGSVQVTSSYVDQIVCSIDSTGNVACMAPQMDSYGNFVGSLFDPPTVTDMVQLSGKGKHVCALRSNTKILCWGTNYYGQCRVPDDNYYYVATGGYHTCAITVSFSVRCWGRNNMGQASPPPNSKFYLIALGYDYSCGIKFDNTIQCWGNNANGQATPPIGQFRAISAGYTTTCAIYKASYYMVCWGARQNSPNGLYSLVSVGNQMTCATGVNGSSTCWDDLSNPISAVPADVKSVDMAFIPQNDGIRLCDLLGWRTYPSGICVQQAIISAVAFNTTSCRSGVSYNSASTACAEVNGRLPTASEVTWDILNNIGCGADAEFIWTETKCLLNGQTGFKVYNKLQNVFQCRDGSANIASTVCVADNNDGPSTCQVGHKCEQNCATIASSSTPTTACYCDDGFAINSDGLSCSLSLVARSPKTCATLNWTTTSSSQFCTQPPSAGSAICSSPLPYLDAQMNCFNKGSRIPTVAEVITSTAASSCSNSMIWTSTPCSGYLFQGYVSLMYGSSGNLIEQCSDPSSAMSVYCVADPDIDECATGRATCPNGQCVNTEGSYTCICSHPHQMSSTGHCAVASGLIGNASCNSLLWPLAGDVCSPFASSNISNITMLSENLNTSNTSNISSTSDTSDTSASQLSNAEDISVISPLSSSLDTSNLSDIPSPSNTSAVSAASSPSDTSAISAASSPSDTSEISPISSTVEMSTTPSVSSSSDTSIVESILRRLNLSPLTTEMCEQSATYDEALSYCMSFGARLPRIEDINNTALWENACTNPTSVWTSTNCSMDCAPKVGKLTINPFILSGNQNATCLVPSAISGVVCVSDQQI